MKTQNQITLDISSSPELKAIFAGKEIGSKCSLEIEFTVSNIDQDTVVGSITKVSSEYGEEEEKEAEPTPDEPFAMKIGPEKTYGP